MENVIKFKHVNKIYKLNKRTNLGGILKFILFKKNNNSKKVLDDVSFSIGKGEKVALLGKNGSGKSTILKLITEVAYPTSGDIYVKGNVNALLELKTGFEMEFTGRENIYLRGILLGLTRKEIKKLEKQIIDFADIGEYIDSPIQKYSSGMRARLGFAIAVNIDPEILLIDEALSVGDEEFKNKCLKKIIEITENKNVTLVLVTHSLEMVKQFCDRGLVIEKGKLTYDGNIDSAIEFYQKSINLK